MAHGKQILQNWLNLLVKGVDSYEYQKPIECEEQLIDFYTNDEKFKNLEIVRLLMCQRALSSISYLGRYIDFLEKESMLDKNTLAIYKKVFYANVFTNRINPIDEAFSYALLNQYENKFNNMRIPFSFPPELQYKEEELKPFSYVIKGYEKKWKKKAIKRRDKAAKLFGKGENGKACDLLRENIDKFGDVYAAEKLGDFFYGRNDKKYALKYYAIAKEYGSKHSHERYYTIFRELKFEENMDLADENKGYVDEVKYLLEANKYGYSEGLKMRIAKLLFTPNRSYSNSELGQMFINYELCYTNSKSYNDYENIINYYSNLLYKGEGIKQNVELAFFGWYSLKDNPDKIYKLAKEERRRIIGVILKQVEIDIEQLDEEVNKPFTNIFDLGLDDNDFDKFQRTGESSEDFKKKKLYYKQALECEAEINIIKNLKKAAELGHSKAMVVLYYYYIKKLDYDKAYYYIFEADKYIKEYKIRKDIFKEMPVEIPSLLDCLYKYDNCYCEEFILEHIDLTNKLDDKLLNKIISYANNGNETFNVWLHKYYSKFDIVKSIDILDRLKDSKYLDYKNHVLEYLDNKKELSKQVLDKIEYYGANGNYVFMCWLHDYYSNFDNAKVMDNLYTLATPDNTKYICELIDRNGGFKPAFNDRFVKFILEPKLSNNMYVMYIRALLYSNKELCKKYKLTYSENKIFETIESAYECKYIDVKDLYNNIRYMLTDCYEYGIGTKMDLAKAASISCRKGGNDIRLSAFAKHVLPDMYSLSNFHKIKEYFISNVELKDYEGIFKEINRYLKADFKLEDLFNIDGRYLGKDLYNKLLTREAEIEKQIQELIRQAEEKIRKEKEAKRLEEERIRREQEAKRLEEERIRKEQEAKRLEEERIRKQQEAKKASVVKTNKVEEVKSTTPTKAPNVSTTSSAPKVEKPKTVSIKTPKYYCEISDDNRHFKDLIFDPYFNRVIGEEMRAIASLRQVLNFPPIPPYPGEYDGFVRLSKAKRDKMYNQELASHRIKVEKYADALFDLENPIKKYGHKNFRRAVWKISNKETLNGMEFAAKVEKEFNNSDYNIGNITVEKIGYYKYENWEYELKDDVYIVERMLAHAPLFVPEIKLKIRVNLRYNSAGGNEYFDAVNAIEGLYDKTTLTRGDIYELHDNMRDELNEALRRDIEKPKEEKWKASQRAERILYKFVNDMFEKYAVFGGTTFENNGKKQYVEGKVQGVKIEYIFKG